jgi:hypothetical protein
MPFPQMTGHEPHGVKTTDETERRNANLRKFTLIRLVKISVD